MVDGSSALRFIKGIRRRLVPQNQRWTVNYRHGIFRQVWHSEIIDYNDKDDDNNYDDVEEEENDSSDDDDDDWVFVLEYAL